MTARLATRIEAEGPMEFHEFMDVALYDPADGFYEHAAAGRRGGAFITSPEVGPLFGEVLSRFLDEQWEARGEPDPFLVVDAGAGQGTLARTLMQSEARCRNAMRLVLVERSANQRNRQPDHCERRADLPARAHVIIANELLDNLAFDIVECVEGAWHEILVTFERERFAFVLGEPRPDIPLASIGEGVRRPWPADARRWLAHARAVAGHVIAFDYFATHATMGPEWLRTYRGHERGRDPLTRPGEVDITADVLLDALPPAAGLRTQAHFLRDFGIDALVTEGRQAWSARAATADLAAIKARSRVAEADALTDPNGLGAFGVAEWLGTFATASIP